MDFEKARDKMVYEQIYKRGITDQTMIDVFTNIPRHLFVPVDKQNVSYEDYPVSIGDGQTISQPYIVALMIKALQIEPGMRVLEIGCGSGYLSAVMSALGARVYAVEIVPTLAQKAKETLDSLGFEVDILVADGGLLQEDVFGNLPTLGWTNLTKAFLKT